MNNKRKNYLVSEEMVKEVTNMLEAYIGHIDDDCAATGCMCDLRGDECSRLVKETVKKFKADLMEKK